MFAETKGDGFRMTEIGGEISADEANNRAEDAKLEDFSEGKHYNDAFLLAKIMNL